MAIGLRMILRALASAPIVHPVIGPSSTAMHKIGPFIMPPGNGLIGDVVIVMPCTLAHALLLNRLEERTLAITRMIVNQGPFGCVLRIA